MIMYMKILKVVFKGLWFVFILFVYFLGVMFYFSCLSVMFDYILEDILVFIFLILFVVGIYVCKKWWFIISCLIFFDFYS